MKDFIKTKFGLYDEDEENFKKIVKDIFPTEWDDDDDRLYWEDFKNQKPNKDGLYDVAWGICWMSEDD
jgi:hypothetical protein